MTAKTFNTTEYQASHRTTPRGRGTWIFAPAGQRDNTDAWVEISGALYSDAKRQLPAGRWIVLP